MEVEDREEPKEYAWRIGGPKPKVSAQIFGETIDRLEKELGVGVGIDSRDVVEEARPVTSPIHDAFEWDVDKNAEAHLRTQARRLLGALQVVRVRVLQEPVVNTKAYFAIGSKATGVLDEEDTGRYRSSDTIQADPTLRIELMRTAYRELQMYLTKYSTVLALVGKSIENLETVIDDISIEITKLLNEAERGRRRRRPVDDDDDRPDGGRPRETTE